MKSILTILFMYLTISVFCQKNYYYSDTVYSGVTLYFKTKTYNLGDEILPCVKKTNYAQNHNFGYLTDGISPFGLFFYYKSKSIEEGKDTCIWTVKHSNDSIDTFKFVFTLKKFDFPENKKHYVYIFEKEERDMSAPEWFNYEIKNDSIYFEGMIQNQCCCLYKMLEANYTKDTLKITRFFSSCGCVCIGNYPFKFSLPFNGKQKVIEFDGKEYNVGIKEKSQNLFVQIEQLNGTVFFYLQNNVFPESIEIYSLTGMLVRNVLVRNEKKYIFSTVGLAKGIYLYKITLENKEIVSGKFILN
ncbi:MAG: T9SS type A sorting domain-containing protein [Bacteroidales bacterium]